jgi:hypothetical protein
MTACIGRRDFITLFGGAAAAWPLTAHGAGPRPRIAVLSISSAQDERKNIAAFVDGLSALGYVMSQNMEIDYRHAEGDTTRLLISSECERFPASTELANNSPIAINRILRLLITGFT